MPYLTIADSPAKSWEEHASVMAALGGEPEGLASRFVGMHEGHIRIVAVWDSPEDAKNFFQNKLGPAFAQALGPEPTGSPSVEGLNVERSFVR